MINKKKGFTLIELMIVVAIVSILAVVAVPRFEDLIRKSKEGATKGSLGALRSAVSIYYAQNEGAYPADISVTPFVGTFMDKVPVVKISGYADSTSVKTDGGVNDAGGWYYDSTTGNVCVNITAADTQGEVVSTW